MLWALQTVLWPCLTAGSGPSKMGVNASSADANFERRPGVEFEDRLAVQMQDAVRSKELAGFQLANVMPR